MAVIHISEETTLSLPELIAKVRAGERVQIDSGADSFDIVLADAPPAKRWTTTEAVRRSTALASSVTLDDNFANDMEEIMRFNRQERPDPWEFS